MTDSQEARVLEVYRSFDRFHVSDLHKLKFDGSVQWFTCPWDASHGAYNRFLKTWGPLLYCPICDKHAWLDRGMGDVIKSVLLDEETRFRKLLGKFENLPDALTPEEAFRLKDEKGCPEELFEDRTDMVEYRRLAESRKVRTKKAVYG